MAYSTFVKQMIKKPILNQTTNLPDIEFDMDDLKELYHLRWSQETAYRDLKYPLCLNSFHSKKYTYIIQEVFARVIMYNYCAETSKQVEIPDHSRKLRYQVNFSEAIKICRSDLRNQDPNNVLNVEDLIAEFCECLSVLDHFATDNKTGLYQTVKEVFKRRRPVQSKTKETEASTTILSECKAS